MTEFPCNQKIESFWGSILAAKQSKSPIFHVIRKGEIFWGKHPNCPVHTRSARILWTPTYLLLINKLFQDFLTFFSDRMTLPVHDFFHFWDLGVFNFFLKNNSAIDPLKLINR